MRINLVAATVLALSVLGVGTSTAYAETEPPTTPTASQPTTVQPPTDQPTEATTTEEPPAIEEFISLDSSSVIRAQTVRVQASCDGATGPVTSPVLEPVQLTPDPEGHQPWAVFGETFVYEDAVPGKYSVSVSCDDRELSTEITVLRVNTIGVNQGSAHAGERAHLFATCRSEELSEATSDAFERPVALQPRKGAEGYFDAYPLIPSTTKAGPYEVSYICGSERVTGGVEVFAPRADQPRTDQPQVPRKPKGAPETGAGESADGPLGVAVLLMLGLGGTAASVGIFARRRFVRR